MLKRIAIFILGLTLSQAALADLHCTAISGQSLDLQYSALASVKASLTTTAGVLQFAGAYIGEGKYSLTDEHGLGAELTTVQTTSTYGGRCGRCAPLTELQTNVKLTYSAGTLLFTCP
jgi:hypothetical protein